jgi:hypothetical protein
MPISRNNSNFVFCPQLSSLFPPLRQVAPPAQKFVDERPLLVVGGTVDARNCPIDQKKKPSMRLLMEN